MGFLWILLPLALIGAVAFALAGGEARRRIADPRGRRPYAVYLLAMMFVTLVMAVASLGRVGSGIAETITDEHAAWAVTTGHSYASVRPVLPETETLTLANDDALADVLRAIAFGAPAFAVYVFHVRRLRELTRREAGDG